MGSTLMDIARFFSTNNNPVTAQEIREFWTSLTKEEKEGYKKEFEELRDE